MLVSAAVLAGVVVPFPSFAEYFGPVSRIPTVGGHWIKQTPKSSSGPPPGTALMDGSAPPEATGAQDLDAAFSARRRLLLP